MEVARLTHDVFYSLDKPIARAAALDSPPPYSAVLEKEHVPSVSRVVQAARELVG